MQVAYSSLLSGKDMDRTLEEFYDWRRIGPHNREFTTRLLSAFNEHLPEVDALLAAHLEHWSPERLALIDSIIIRLAVTEFLYLDEVPPKVTLNEYVGLARLFSTGDSSRFVNGVLDAVYKTLNKKSGENTTHNISSPDGG